MEGGKSTGKLREWEKVTIISCYYKPFPADFEWLLWMLWLINVNNIHSQSFYLTVTMVIFNNEWLYTCLNSTSRYTVWVWPQLYKVTHLHDATRVQVTAQLLHNHTDLRCLQTVSGYLGMSRFCILKGKWQVTGTTTGYITSLLQSMPYTTDHCYPSSVTSSSYICACCNNSSGSYWPVRDPFLIICFQCKW